MTLVLRYAARSDRGLVRANNEDSVYAGARLLALADGMGGHAAGEVASQLVIAALAHLDDDEPGGDLLAKLNDAVHDGNAAIAAHVEADPELEGMGTTLSAILFAGTRLGMVHIGDSRGYLMRDGELTQITKDDTFVQTLVDDGRITAEEAHSHPQRSLIMKALTGHEVEPTLTMREVRAGDRYLLCSDGLSDPVSHETIQAAMQIPDVVDCADRLIELALRGGGPDNVTVVVADVVDYEYGQTAPILAGAVSGQDDDTLPPNTAAGRASAFNPKRAAAAAKKPVAQPDPPQRKSHTRRNLIIGAILLILLLVSGLAIGRYLIRSNYYVAGYNGSVYIMRGIPGSLLGLPLQEPYLLACLDTHSEMTIIGVDDTHAGCQPMKVADLRESGRAQVTAGLPTGTVDDAIRQLKELSRSSLLPLCAPPVVAPPAAPAPAPGAPAPSLSVVPQPPRGPAPGPEAPASTTPAPTTAPTAAPGPAPVPNPSSPAPVPATPTVPAAPSPTATALPPPPQEPGTNCRNAS
ncbi:PP2C family protein-serine/threonine phosphatase [Mycolicibacterium aubagnense]|uniref:Serine/threonine protein phosphatase n=1 Tax=Mycolicibacterium aubagnense TaxID=319707 RepID=A0ABM7IFQ7_9MYCO|nr:protein phosphatase 2C domain-containing protein [Mycolicibacterium aubagnense]TLH57027.1 serine/threonine protein phosphatase [Mycolicibacterium aubagnense]WGI32812.1 protein phosphatase 2C domain-containing protein [Mycolicibacterium aubagnense]BBX85526.1 serine/threonine protein phosphatase [Mycolicibacterium aubagnense]